MAGCHKLAFIDSQNTVGLFAFPPKTRRAHQSPGRLGSDHIAIQAAALCGHGQRDAGIDINSFGINKVYLILMKMKNEGFDKGTLIAQTIWRGVSAWHLSTADVVTRSVNIDIYHCINISLTRTSALSFRVSSLKIRASWVSCFAENKPIGRFLSMTGG